MGSWTLDDIRWDRFDRSRLDPQIVPIVKAASLVELNGGAYARHLSRVFDDDPGFQASAARWGEEEIQHGRALGRWAELADPEFDFAAAFDRFQAGYQRDLVVRRGECVVTGRRLCGREGCPVSGQRVPGQFGERSG